MFTHTGHVLMTAHFLLTGYLFIWSLVGIDPARRGRRTRSGWCCC